MGHKKYKPLYTKRLVSVLAGTALAAALVVNGTTGAEARKQQLEIDKAIVVTKQIIEDEKDMSRPVRYLSFITRGLNDYLNKNITGDHFLTIYNNQVPPLDETRTINQAIKYNFKFKDELLDVLEREEHFNENNKFNFIGAGAGAAFALGSGCYFTAKIKKAKKEDELALEEAVNAQEPSSDVE